MFRFGSPTPRKKKDSSATVHALQIRDSVHSYNSNEEPLETTILTVPELRNEDDTLGNVASDIVVTAYNKRLPAWRKVKEKDPNQEKWNNRFEFIAACFGFIIGCYGLLTLPVSAVQYGAASFLIAFYILSVVLGIPVLFFETAIGQFSGQGPAEVFQIIPIAIGLGYTILFEGIYKAFRENVYAARYAFVLFDCFRMNTRWENETAINALEDLMFYYNTTVLNIDNSNQGNLGALHWPLVGCLAFSWFLIFLCIWRPINTLGVVMSILVPTTVVLFLSLLIAILTLPGANAGLTYFLTPGKELMGFDVWNQAAVCLLKMMGFGYGINILFGSYTRFQSPAHIDCLIVSIVAMLTSLVACLFLFAGIGVVSNSMGVDIGVFRTMIVNNTYFLRHDYVLFSTVLNQLPSPTIWCGIFYLIAFTQSVTTVTAQTSLISRSLYSFYPMLRLHPLLTSLAIVIPLFLLGLPFVTRNGNEPLDSMAHNAVVQHIIVILKLLAFVFCYGMKRLRSDLDFMLQYNPNIFYRISWILTPFFLTVTMVYFVVTVKLDHYLYEWKLMLVLWVISFVVVLIPIPLYAVIALVKFYRRGDLRGAFRPHSEEDVLARETMATNTRDRLKFWSNGSNSSAESASLSRLSSGETRRYSKSTVLPSSMNLMDRRMRGSSASTDASSTERFKSNLNLTGRLPPVISEDAVSSNTERFKSNLNLAGRLPPGISVDAVSSSTERLKLEMQRAPPHYVNPARIRRRSQNN